MNPYAIAVTQPKKMLGNLLSWLDKAEAHAESRNFDPAVYLDTRLRPDMFPLRRQIQAATDTAKFLPARLTGREAPSHADDEQTLPQLRARVQEVIDYLDSFSSDDFDGAAERKVVVPFLPEGTWVRGEDYALEFAIPNFSFHITTSYAILRYSGVDLGKRDFIGGMNIQQ